MPRNADEAVEWPDEQVPDLAEVIRNLDLFSNNDSFDPDLTEELPCPKKPQ